VATISPGANDPLGVTADEQQSSSPRSAQAPPLTLTAEASRPAYLAPKRARRAYGDRTMTRTTAEVLPANPGALPSLNFVIQAMLNAHALDWAPTQVHNCRTYLLSSTGRFQQWCRAEAITSIDQLTTERVAGFLAAVADRQQGPGLKASTVTKYRGHMRSLARFQAATPGFGSGLLDIERIPAPRLPRETVRRALSVEEEGRIVAACVTTRDRLIIELFLATGIRVSEMAALVLPNLLLDARPPRIVVRGSVHDPERTKNGRPRQVPFRKTYASLPRRLGDWIQKERDPSGLSPRQELFLASPRVPSTHAGAPPLGIYGMERLCARISVRAGLHFSPHMLRHSWATRLVNAGVQPIHLMEVGGWSSVEMVRRYYSPNDDEILAAIAATGA
jgi:integrase